jgi:hypothetical protein
MSEYFLNPKHAVTTAHDKFGAQTKTVNTLNMKQQ